MYIDLAIINPKRQEWRRHLADKGVGAAADVKERKKREFYADKIDWNRGMFLPFIMEIQGGVGRAAQKFMIELEKRKLQRSCTLTDTPTSIANLNLMTSLSIELQRLNSEMSLQRLPSDKALEVNDTSRLESAKRSAKNGH